MLWLVMKLWLKWSRKTSEDIPNSKMRCVRPAPMEDKNLQHYLLLSVNIKDSDSGNPSWTTNLIVHRVSLCSSLSSLWQSTLLLLKKISNTRLPRQWFFAQTGDDRILSTLDNPSLSRNVKLGFLFFPPLSLSPTPS